MTVPIRSLAIEGAENDALAAGGGGQRVRARMLRPSASDSGCMKLTEPPCATVSISISLSAAQMSGEDFSGLDLDVSHGLSAPRKRNDIGAGRGALVGKGHFRRRSKSEAIAGAEFMAFAAFGDDERAGQHPEHLADMGVGDAGRVTRCFAGISTRMISTG